MEHFLTPSAIILMLVKIQNGKRQVLLQQRQNTGFADGLWDLSCSGHVEQNESMTDAAIREAKEELGISIDRCNLKFFTLIHKRDKACNLTYYNAYFVCTEYADQPRICEPDKCSKLEWFDFDNLPATLIPDRQSALQAYTNGEHYIEYGW
jgi:8-oxo-dGTP pyrophosphatase MutT (NUDIX family)